MANSSVSDAQLHQFFNAIDTDHTNCLNPTELQRALLLNSDGSPFNFDTIQLLFNMFDSDRSGSIHFQEFASLWRYIEDWKKIFVTFDRDNSGTVDSSELKTALHAFGFNVSDRFLNIVIRKYNSRHRVPGGPKNSLQHNATVNFDSFVQICVTIKSLTDTFRTVDSDGDGWAKINYEEMLELIVKNI
ncbi:3521_t:CDS:1 [Ambispora gerdemannii]|uniref:3521_t:CDS:1 n=1 Tax=Ambispora gerdemannii TaxID=144530 RepID=A0A9N9CL33_9GLOM|nr:3521_t:CDS:1 [Ambispora gerdemannii]